jgi:hypothetical protein
MKRGKEGGSKPPGNLRYEENYDYNAKNQKPENEDPKKDRNQQQASEEDLELRLGSYWEHNKNSKNPYGNNNYEKLEQQTISLRILGIPDLTKVNVSLSWNVDELKYLLGQESGLQMDHLDLYFGGEKLVSDVTLTNYGFIDESVITVVIHSRS